ncbi:MAG: FAD-dependent oxidoreductase, partial [Planctomycetota bacterium]
MNQTHLKKIGSVMVVGGGITGLQSSLDLAESGYKVYLVERTTAVGGNMSALDKTFPTGDCSMCMIAPRLVEVSRHRNIQIITNAEITSVSGAAGHYEVNLKKYPRFVIQDKCNACGDCVKVCPVQACNDFDQDIGQRTAIGRRYAQAVPNTFDVIKKGTSPCRVACPADVNAHAYVALIAQRKYSEALEVVRRVLPFPSVCGRLCHHPCETECRRGEIDKPIAIRPLKRFIADMMRESGEPPPEKLPVTRPEKIAIIGAGPAGLSCALRLKEKGYSVTVFEASDKAGGMMTLSVPEYRTPEAVVQYDINRILDTGLEIKFNTRIGADIPLAKLREDYQSIFIAVGCPDPARLPLEGSEADGVLYGLSFLKDVKRGLNNKISGKRVTVIGGGNVAIDCARSAVRLGAKEVTIVCLETRDMDHQDRMPAHLWEIEEAEAERVKVKGSLCPKKIISTNGRVIGLELARCESVYEITPTSKKFAPKICDTERQSMETDIVIIAIGQRANLTGFEEIEKTPAGLIKTDAVTRQTNITNIFAGGDIASGPASVIEAVSQGNEAAISIDRFLNKQDIRSGRARQPKIADLPDGKIAKKKRIDPLTVSVAERITTFKEIELNYPEELAVAEAQRCLNCAVCCECLECVKACKPEAIDHTMVTQESELKVGSIILSP